MINVTNRPIMLAEGAELDRRIRVGIKKLTIALDLKYKIQLKIASAPRKRDGFGRHPGKWIYIYFSDDKLIDTQYGDAFVQTLFDIASIDSRNVGSATAFNKLNGFFRNMPSLSACVITRVKGHIKLLLLSLWSENAIILPYKFQFGGAALKFYDVIIRAFETEVASFFRNFKVRGNSSCRNPNLPKLPKSAAETLSNFGPRLIWATDYHLLENINFVEIIKLHQAIVNDESNAYGRPPLSLMLHEILNFQPNRVSFSAMDIANFVIWTHTPKAKKYQIEDFISRKEMILKEININKKDVNKINRPIGTNSKNLQRIHLSTAKLKKNEKFAVLIEIDSHESIVEYFSKMQGTERRGLEWLKCRAPYNGREHLDLQPLSGLWIEAWAAWLKFRKNVQGYDSKKGPDAAFNLLCDYLFLYLPWWMELFPDNQLNFPLSPNQLKRSVFIHRTELYAGESIPIDKLPLTFLDILPFRRLNPRSRYDAINQLKLFLDWVGVEFEEDERIAGKSYRNPLNSIDLPRVQKKTKTTKIPFSKRVYPHLLFYCYGTEAFGEYLQSLAMDRPSIFLGKSFRNKNFLSTGPLSYQVSSTGVVSQEYLEDWPESYGYVPFITYRGKNYPLYRCPNIYQWAVRTIDLDRYAISGGITQRWIPHLGSLRMFLGALETGLRLQSIQWLDLRYWDVINKRDGVPVNYDFNMKELLKARFALPLYISTDKSKNEPWAVLTVFRVRSCFYREQYFRDSIKEVGMDTLVDYEGIQNSRFGQILPLFRSTFSQAPLSDSVYRNYWVHLLWGFEEYFDLNVSADNEFIQFVYVKKTDFESVPDYCETNPTKFLAIHTPHACRATYATNRTGVLDTSDIAAQLGHSSLFVTMHYTVSTPEIVAEKLASVDRNILAEFQNEDFNPTYIRADVPESALYKSFKANRSQAIDSFQFAPSVSIWSTDELSPNYDGLMLLRNSPASQIILRETHICPVGEACPADIVIKIGGPHRCGLCPLSMRCVDHLPAIAAKINQLKMHVRYNWQRAQQLLAKKEQDSIVDELFETAERCTNEIASWQYCHDILIKMLHSRDAGMKGRVHVFEPDIVKKHLQLVSKDRTLIEFYLQRIIEANTYPSLNDPHIQLIATRYSRHIRSGELLPSLEEDPVAIIAGYVKTQIDSRGLTLTDIANEIDRIELARKEGRSLLLSNQTFLLSDLQKDE